MRKHNKTVVLCACMAGLMMTGCASKDTVPNKTVAETTTAAATEKASISNAEPETEAPAEPDTFEALEVTVPYGGAFTYLDMGETKLYMQPTKAFNNEDGKVYATSTDVWGLDQQGRTVVFGHLDGSEEYPISQDGVYLYSYMPDMVVKYTVGTDVLVPEEVSIAVEEDGITSYMNITGTTQEESDDPAVFQKLVDEIKSADPVEFEVVGGGAYVEPVMEETEETAEVAEPEADEIAEEETIEAEAETEAAGE